MFHSNDFYSEGDPSSRRIIAIIDLEIPALQNLQRVSRCDTKRGREGARRNTGFAAYPSPRRNRCCAEGTGCLGFTSHYLYRFYEALDATNSSLGSQLSLEVCTGWGKQLQSAWETENFAQLGESCGGGNATVFSAVVTQMLAAMATMQRTLTKLVSLQESSGSANRAVECSCMSRTNDSRPADTLVESHSLAGYLYNWYTQDLWRTAKQKKQQFIRADLILCVNIMIVASGRDVDIPSAPLEHNGVSYRPWKQALWTLAEDLDKSTNAVLGGVDGKGRSKTAGLLRKKWSKLRTIHRSAYDALCLAFIKRKASGRIADRYTPDSHKWSQKDL